MASASGRARPGQVTLEGGSSSKAHSYQDTIDALREDVGRRQKAHIREQRDAQTKIQTLQRDIDKTTRMHSVTEQLAEKRMGGLRSVHDTILRNIEHVQEQTSRILQEQERDLLRAFRARLFDVQTELEKERARAEDGAAVWIEKNRQLEKELEWAKDMADRLDRHNQTLAAENSRIKTQFKTEQDDREYLIRQLVAAKKDNARLRQDNEALKGELDTARQEAEQRRAEAAVPAAFGASAGSTAEQGAGGASESEARYREVIKRLKRVLDTERRSLRQVRAAYTADLQARSALETFLRGAVEEVKAEVEARRKRAEGGGPGRALASAGSSILRGSSAGGDSQSGMGGKVADELDTMVLESMAPEQRGNILLRLLRQEQVLNKVFGEVFPSSSGS